MLLLLLLLLMMMMMLGEVIRAASSGCNVINIDIE